MLPHAVVIDLYGASEACLLLLTERRTRGRMLLYVAVRQLLVEALLSSTVDGLNKSRAASSVGVPAPDDESVGAALGKGDQKAPAAQTTDDHDVLFIDDLARELKTSTRTIERKLRARGDLPREMPHVDNQHRWLRKTVREWMERGDTGHRLRRIS